MSDLPFRFVHASDLHLETLPHGLAEIPDHLRELFVESAYWAAERVFETVLAEEAEFLLLCGDIVHPQHTGPRGPIFLAEQFRRLAERNVAVYWAGGRVDPPEAWPSAVDLPENVHVFPRGRVDEFVHQRDGMPLARLMGASLDRQRTARLGDFDPDPSGLFSIAVIHGTADAAALKARAIHYWALGGRHNRSTLFSSSQVAHYCGSPQGRRPREHGVHGCTLVQVDSQQRGRTSLRPTDVVRWIDARVVVDETTDRDDLEAELRQRVQALAETAASIDLLISWTVLPANLAAGKGPLLSQLRRGGLAGELLDMLRSEYGSGPPVAWSVSLDVELSDALPSQWYEQETICGDFLRAVRQLQVNEDEPFDLQSYVAEKHLAGTLASAVTPADQAAREGVLREAAVLGVDLLSGDPPSPEESRS